MLILSDVKYLEPLLKLNFKLQISRLNLIIIGIILI